MNNKNPERFIALIIAALLLCVVLVGCGEKPLTLEEQLELGARYLNELDYQNSVIAFTAAIEIDEKCIEAFVGRGDAYMALAVTTEATVENLALAQADYETVLQLDENAADIYERLADIYMQQGDSEKIQEILQQGLDKTGDERFQTRLDELIGQKAEQQEQIEREAWRDQMDESAIEYGVIGFTQRGNYRLLEDFTPEEQQLITDFATAVIADDTETLVSLASAPDLPQILYLYTIWNDYKMYVHAVTNDVQIELRPENGIGYYCKSMAGYDTVFQASCPCVDWQWNGAYEGGYSYQFEDGNDIVYHNDDIKGTMKNGVRQGTFVEEYTVTRSSDPAGSSSYYTTEEVYQDGVLVDSKIYMDGELTQEMSEEQRQSLADVIYGINDICYHSEEIYW